MWKSKIRMQLLSTKITIPYVIKICAKNSLSDMPPTWNLCNFSLNNFVYVFCVYLFTKLMYSFLYITLILVYLGIRLLEPWVNSMVKHFLYVITYNSCKIHDIWTCLYLNEIQWKLTFSSDTSKNDNLNFTMYHIYHWH